MTSAYRESVCHMTWTQTHFCSCCNRCCSSIVAQGSEMSEARLGVESLWVWCLCELLITRLETLRPTSAGRTGEPSDPLFPWGVSGGGVHGGLCDGWMTVELLVLVAVWDCGDTKVLFWLVCLTRTDDGWLDVTSFSKQRTCLHKNIFIWTKCIEVLNETYKKKKKKLTAHRHTNPESHFEFEGAVGARVLQGELLIYRHVRLLQERTKCHPHTTQRALVLTIPHLRHTNNIYTCHLTNRMC